jgi:hypothetical protein
MSLLSISLLCIAYVALSYLQCSKFADRQNSAATVLPAFVECLQSLPNIHTLHIVNVIGQLNTAIKTAFRGHRFMLILTVILPFVAHRIWSSCPLAKDISCMSYKEKVSVSVIAKRCKTVEVLSMAASSRNTTNRESKCPRLPQY